jgi:hypothetical protein
MLVKVACMWIPTLFYTIKASLIIWYHWSLIGKQKVSWEEASDLEFLPPKCVCAW